MVVVARSPQRDGDDRHIVDGPGFDEGTAGPRRDSIEVGRKFFVQPDERPFLVFANVEAHHDHRLPGAGCRVQVFDSWHFPEQLLHRARDSLLDFLGAGSWLGD
jgi:hypothetical protein